jgi:sugar lactone lactonase YvrE
VVVDKYAIVTAMKPVDILSARNIVGEGILWDSRRGLLWWTDIQGRELYQYDWTDAAIRVLDTPERVGSFGFVAGSDRLITAFASGIALYDAYERTVEWLARPDSIIPGIRFNDGRVDRRGRFWSGTMVEDAQCTASGSLYSVDGTAEIRCHVRGIRISNGLCMSPDGTRLYFADSPTRTIFVYEVIEPEGSLGPRQVFAHTPDGAQPDGAAVDVDGCVWSAHWGAGCVVRYTPEGRIDRTIQVPACQPTCVCFGGPDLDVLCVTSAREGLNETRLQSEPHAGAVFLYRTGVQGLPEPEYQP